MTKAWTTTMRLTTALAWFFALATLTPLVAFIALGWPGNGRTTFAATRVGESTYNAFGLTYQGLMGTIWLWSQVAVLGGAIVLSTLRMKGLRRVGHVVLIAWAALWLGNAIWLPMVGGGSPRGLWVTVIGAFFLATVVRAVRGWRERPRPVEGADATPDHATLSRAG